MILQNIKVNFSMESLKDVENLQTICFAMKEFFIKVCFMDKEWSFISRGKLFKEFWSKIAFREEHTSMQMVIFMKVNLKIMKNQEKVSTNS